MASTAEESLQRLQQRLIDTVEAGDQKAAREIYGEVHAVYKDLSEFIDDAKRKAEKAATSSQSGATSSDILTLAEKLSITLGAAPEWTLGNPMIGFHAPAPQDMQMRLGKLTNTIIELQPVDGEGGDEGEHFSKRTRKASDDENDRHEDVQC